jgi:creatinine amidohydrolase
MESYASMAIARLFHELSRSELREIAAEALLVLPVGAIEQHGPHLPVGTDTFAVEYIARTAAAEAAAMIPVLVAPTLPFGSSHHHLTFGGTMSLSTETYYRVLIDLTESLITSGFRRIFILNGHGGNNELIHLVARDLALKHPAALAAASYWNIAWDALVAESAHVPGRLPGHSGAFETSLILALRSELVQQPLPERADASGGDPRGFYSPYRSEIHGAWQHIDGYTDSPARGNAQDGKRYLAAAVRAVAAAMIAFYAASKGN